MPVCGHLCLVYIVERAKNLAHGVPAQHVDVTCSRIVSRSWCADWHSRGMRVVRGDAYQPPSTHLDRQCTRQRPDVAASAMTDHDRAKWAGTRRFEQDALQIERHTVERTSVRPRRTLRRLGITLQGEGAARWRWRRCRRRR